MVTPPSKPMTGEQAAKSGLITENSKKTFDSLMNLSTIMGRTDSLTYRIEAVMVICNQLGILAGRAGGNQNSGELEPTKYRKSSPMGTTPTMNLPSDINALQAQSFITKAPVENGQSTLFSVSRSSSYNPEPVYADKRVYKNYFGPPLAPRGSLSRVITNYEVRSGGSGGDITLTGFWTGITARTKNGQEYGFLDDHFEPAKSKRKPPLAQRDLRGATVYEQDQVRRQITFWMREVMGMPV